MTEKRFTVETFIEDFPCGFKDLEDNECEIRCDGKPMTYRAVTDLLNELSEEVMDLRRENIKFKLTVSEIIEDMQKYVDDNQLVYINQSYVDWIKKEVDTTLYSQKKELEE